MHTWRSYHNHAKKFKPQYCSETKSYYHKTIHKSKYLHNHNQIHFSLQAQTSCATCQIFVHNHTMILSLTRVPHCYTQPFMQWACRINNYFHPFFFWSLSKKQWHFLWPKLCGAHVFWSDCHLQLITWITCWLESNKCKQNMWKIQGGKIYHFDYTLTIELDINILLPNFS
jgi:hypothetical protein